MKSKKKKLINIVEVSMRVIWPIGIIILAILMILTPILGNRNYFTDLFSHFQLQYTLGGILLLITTYFIKGSYKLRKPFIAFLLLHYALLIHPLSLMPIQDTDSSPDIFFMNSSYFNDEIGPIVNTIQSHDLETVAFVELNEQLRDEISEIYGEPIVYKDKGVHSCAIFSKGNSQELSVKPKSEFHLPTCLAKIDGYTYIVIHPYPPLSKHMYIDQTILFEQVAQYINELEAAEEFFILLGDFNSTYYSSTFRESFGKYHNKNIYTWSVGTLLMIPIDHAMSNTDISIKRSKVLTSDHTGLFVWKAEAR